MAIIENLIKNEEYKLALAEIEQELAGNAYNIDLLSLKATVHHKLEEYTEEITIYNSLINLIPGNAGNYAARGLSYHAIGEHKQALADFTKAIELEPDNGYRYASRAFIKDYQGDHLGAMDDYNKALKLDPEDMISLNNRGLVEEKLGRQHLAQESFARADALAGVDNQQYNQLKHPTDEEKKHKSLGLKFFLHTLKNLFTSASERKNFFDFLLKRK